MSTKSALRHSLEQPTVQPETLALLVETVRRSLNLSEEQWRRLHRTLPSTTELSQTIGQCLPPATRLSAEIVAMREI